MPRIAARTLALFFLFVATAARAQEPAPGSTPPSPASPSPSPAAPPAPVDSMAAPSSGEPMERIHAAPAPRRSEYNHNLQANVRGTFGTGLRYVFPYQATTVCGPSNQMTNCVGRLPMFFDVDGGFAVSDGLELVVLARFGVEADFDAQSPFALAFGIRGYPSPNDPVKFFLAALAVVDLTNRPTLPTSGADFAGRFDAGLQFDIVRWFGIYVQGGALIGFARWLRFEIAGGAGLQVRLP